MPSRAPPTPHETALQETLDAGLVALGSLRDTIAQDPRATIEPPRHPISAREALGVLEALRGDRAGKRSPLEVERTLGEGGMGIVQLATQVSMGRKVAVKTLRKDHHGEGATLRLLREAWVTGTLEHPNVVPVYDVGLDEHGAPVIVLKRIEGVHWGELLGDEATVRARFRARDLLEWNLGILMHVCNAVHFAHSRGIVHRDLKPENVMIGEFGEVYLLDWGIAVSLRDDGSGRLPLARDVREPAGTPCYMAPESLAVDQSVISERTDVYLLGAILYEILTGEPPHTGADAVAVVASILSKDPTFPDGAPSELARICAHALSRDPGARWESAEQFRRALEDYLEHRESETLAAEADASLAVMRQESSDRGAATSERRQRVYDAFGACRFGYREALRIWPGNEQARASFRAAITAMIELELEGRDVRAARVLLGELGELGAVPPDLATRVGALAEEREAEALRTRELERLGREYDKKTGQRTRAFLGLLAGFAWTALPPIMGWLETPETTYRNAVAAPVALMVAFFGVASWARDSMTKTRINRALLGVAFVTLLTQLLLTVGAAMLRVSPAAASSLCMLLWGAIAAAVAATVERRFAVAAVGFFASFFVSCVRPEWRWWLMSAGNLVLTLVMVWAWGAGLFVTPARAPRSQAGA
ncbi:MAG: serine/threonine protein kinase [Deltaproteobacteria bacterium]|nr:serine/threonine protein kinase [Deltaproteobacteria bacterium]